MYSLQNLLTIPFTARSVRPIFKGDLAITGVVGILTSRLITCAVPGVVWPLQSHGGHPEDWIRVPGVDEPAKSTTEHQHCKMKQAKQHHQHNLTSWLTKCNRGSGYFSRASISCASFCARHDGKRDKEKGLIKVIHRWDVRVASTSWSFRRLTVK